MPDAPLPNAARSASLFTTIALAAIVGLLLPALAIGGWLVVWREPMAMHEALQRQLDERLDLLAKSLPVLVWNLDKAAADEVVAAAMQSSEVVRITVVEAAARLPWVDVQDAARRGGRTLEGQRAVMHSGRTIAHVSVELSDRRLAEAAARQRGAYVATVGVQLLISLALVVGLLHSRVLRPLRRLGAFADELAGGRFGAPMPPTRHDEIGQLGGAMEQMRRALQQQFSEQTALIARLRGIGETVPGVVYQLQRGADTRLRFRFVSDAVRQHLGLEPQALLEDAQRFFACVHADDRVAVHSALARSADTGSPWQQEFRVRAPQDSGGADAGERWLYANAVAQRGADGTVVWHGFLTDISRQRRDTEELQRHRFHLEELVQARTTELARASEAAQAANRAKSAFLANMSHEIRTPLNAILGLGYLMRRDTQDAEQLARLGKVDIAAQHLLAVTNQVLDLSKIEAGKLQLETAPFELDALLASIAGMTSTHAAAQGLDFSIEQPASLRGLALVGDRQRITEVLLNFCSNAIKFTERGRVTLRLHEVARKGRMRRLRFEVNDSGIGIAPEVLQRLFREFEQADSSTTRRFGGTGLGLAISRRLAELMGGEVGADSEPGQGSRFWLVVPLLDTTPTLPPAPGRHDEARRPFEGQRILLAEDNPVNQEVAVAMLRGAGLEVAVAGNGREAVELALGGDYALVLMDVQMPELDGLDATRELRRRGWRRPILAMTANAFAEERERCLAAGMDDHVGKPAAAVDLFAAVGRWLGRESPAVRARESS